MQDISLNVKVLALADELTPLLDSERSSRIRRDAKFNLRRASLEIISY